MAEKDWGFNDLEKDTSLVVGGIYEDGEFATIDIEQTVFYHY